ncbi:MAG: tripartite tricarboxylate transporter family receptor [Hyphomicrobiales bacterium]|nr:tripartite tricarboxylate transporter family receptor [Hyphomicrobiales bacterium]
MRLPKWIALGFALLQASSASADDFYKGKQIFLILSAGEGGGYTSYARVFAPYFTAHIPGKPTIVIQNMPGGGGIRAMSQLANNSPRDGTALGLVHSSVPFAPLYGVKAAAFDPRQMAWIGSLATASAMCVSWFKSGIKSFDDLKTREFIVGGSGAGSQMETLPTMLNKIFGTKIKVISGYKGGNDVFLAMERGEVQGRCGGLVSSIRSTRPDWFPKHMVDVPIQISLERSKLFPDVPAVVEYASDDRTRNVLELVLSPQAMDRPVVAPPGVPAERIALLRRAFHDAMNDPGFLAEAAKQNLEIDEVSGEKVEQVVARAYAMPPEIVRIANESMNLTGVSGE